MLRVALVTPWDIEDPRSWSGVVAPMARALSERCELVPLSTRGVRDSLVDRALARLLDRRWGKKYLVGHAVSTSIKRGRQLRRRLADATPDVIVAVAASQDIAFLRTDIPIIQVSDTTLAAITDYYDLFRDLHTISRWQAQIVGALSSRRARHVLAATEWAAQRLVEDDNVPMNRITVAPFGPAIQATLGSPQVSQPSKLLRVLAVMSDWERKGGDRVLAVHEELEEEGRPIELTVVGRTPPLPARVMSPGVVSRDLMAKIYADHDVLLELARSNTAGVTMTDAATSGLPIVATRTGGVATIVLDGQSGILVENDDRLAVSEAVDALMRVKERLGEMSSAAREHANARLSWDAWSEVALDVAREVAATECRKPPRE